MSPSDDPDAIDDVSETVDAVHDARMTADGSNGLAAAGETKTADLANENPYEYM